VAEQKSLGFEVDLSRALPQALRTDPQRLQQILKNLLSNAFKFTDVGSVTLRVRPADASVRLEHRALRDARSVIAFAVVDTGIGIPKNKHRLIFEAFQQADGTTSRKYGGTGLGLSICREMAGLLGGEIHVESRVGEGSTFTLYLPERYQTDALENSGDDHHASVASLRAPRRGESEAPPEIASFLARQVKLLLLVEDNESERQSIAELLAGRGDIEVTAVPSAEGALSALEMGKYDCMVVDMMLPGISGAHLIEAVKTSPKHQGLPIVVFTSKELSREDEQALRRYAESVIVKSGAQSIERLLSETAPFLHRVGAAPREDAAGQEHPSLPESLEPHDAGALAGRKILVVDDDVRNIFALTSMLESHHMEVLHAENGKAAISALDQHPDVDIVLMDIMMPGMDGYETIKLVRKDPLHKSLPIIAITAKALKGDRQKCIDAGASDYLPKPIEPTRLVELIRHWSRVH